MRGESQRVPTPLTPSLESLLGEAMLAAIVLKLEFSLETWMDEGVPAWRAVFRRRKDSSSWSGLDPVDPTKAVARAIGMLRAGGFLWKKT